MYVYVCIYLFNYKCIYFRDAPKWKFLAEAKAEQNETLGRIPNTVFRFFFFPM